jgi:plastocyanin
MFYESDSGNAPPRANISGPNTGLGQPAVYVDQNGTIYAANYYIPNPPYSSVTVYPPGSNGDVTPTTTITCGGISGPTGVATDAKGNIYVANVGNSVSIIPAGASGCVAGNPIIQGPNTQLDQPERLMVTPDGTIYVSNFGSGPHYNGRVTVYAPGSNGNVAPIKVSLPGPYQPFGIASDVAGDVYVSGQYNEVKIYQPGLQHVEKTFQVGTVGGTTGIGVTVDGHEFVPNGDVYGISEYAPDGGPVVNTISISPSVGVLSLALFEQNQSVGMRLTGETPTNDPTYGFILGYANGGISKTSAVVGLTAGDPVQFVNADVSLTHTASFLGDASEDGAPWPSTFNGSSTKSPPGTSISAPGFSTGSIAPGKLSAVYTAGVPGFYMIGCAFHYDSNQMRTVVIVH